MIITVCRLRDLILCEALTLALECEALALALYCLALALTLALTLLALLTSLIKNIRFQFLRINSDLRPTIKFIVKYI